jgi:tetratricopeptide (TPR) repeat protein
MSAPVTTTAEELARIDEALRSNSTDTVPMAQRFVKAHPANIDGWMFLGRAYHVRGDFALFLEAATQALAIDPADPLARAMMVDALYRSGRVDEAFTLARRLETEKKFDPAILIELGTFYGQTNNFKEAARVLERVRVLQPTNAKVLQSLAAAYAALGELDKTEAMMDTLLKRYPHEYDAYYNRSGLRKQTRERNHVAQIEALLKEPLYSESAEPVLCYALAKELEDLKEWKRSFHYLKRGADARRRTMEYDVKNDIAYLHRIAAAYDERFFAQARKGFTGRAPIFVLGMPRSGTTLVDRIVSSHSKVASIGESTEFTIAMLRQSGRNEAGDLLFDDADTFDYERIGREFCSAVDGMLPGAEHVLDKTPPNFYHVGPIAAALPNARIIHLRRHPVANCYAIYKTLFRAGFLYTYDPAEMARFYLAYLALMEHWRQVLPGRFLDVDYEEIVRDQEGMSRRMIEWCGLEWEDDVLAFEKNKKTPTLTASVSQVRQKIYDSSLEQWRNYEQELMPMIRVFESAGLSVR